MIRWEEPKREAVKDRRTGMPTGSFHSYQESIEPRGYIINLVPHGERCHLQCLHVSEDGRITHIGTHSDLDKRDRGGKNAAATALRAACEAHATAVASSPADPPAD